MQAENANELSMKPAREEDIPKVTHTGVMDLLGVKARVHRLDNGRTVIEAEDFEKILEAMGITLAEVLKTTS